VRNFEENPAGWDWVESKWTIDVGKVGVETNSDGWYNNNAFGSFTASHKNCTRAGQSGLVLYGIQGTGSLFVRSIEGCYFNVMGLPVHHLFKELARALEF
jgi:hypothetical protein